LANKGGRRDGGNKVTTYVALFVNQQQVNALAAIDCVRAVTVEANHEVEARNKIETIRRDLQTRGWSLDTGSFIGGGIYIARDEAGIRKELWDL
jgi:hypothetical protein